ncbi:MAG: RagB/SusD family nutrient uptake outer membrane protein [Rikenellaceae bacterium]
MKKIILLLSGITALIFSSCAEIRFGDDAFSEAPDQEGASIEEMFSSTYNADRVLAAAYTYLPYGIPTAADNKLGSNVLESITDLMMSWKAGQTDGPSNLYYNGALSGSLNSTISGSEAYTFADEDSYYAIRYGWLYVENAHLIPDIDDTRRRERIAEAKMIIALSYAEMLRYVGGVPLIDRAIETSDKMEFPRATFAETVDFIVDLLDEAAADLPWRQSDLSVDGARMTKAAAMGLKLRVLLFAASPTFNSATPWHTEANAYTRYETYDDAHWEAAYNAGKAFFTALAANGHYSLVQASSDNHDAYRAAFRSAYLETGSTESLISIRKSISTSYHSQLAPNVIFSGPTLSYVNMFDWADGTPFNAAEFDWNVDWDSEEPYSIPFFVPVEGQIPGTATRDPRLYETVASPGALCYSGVVASVHSNATDFQGFAAHTGFYIMKFNLENSSDRNTPPHWPYLRLAEIYLSYAEAINEHEGTPTNAYAYVDAVRERVGLGAVPNRNMSQEEFRQYILVERAKEFGLEEVRWFDMVRWGLKEDFTKPLLKLTSVGLDSTTSPTKFSFAVSEIPTTRYWATSWDTKWYLAPIPQDEVNLGYGMTQNPGWQSVEVTNN